MEECGQIGATFYGSLFKHCTTVPIWADWDSGTVHMYHENVYNTAWGKSGGSSKRRRNQ